MLRRGLVVLEHRDGDEFSGIKRVFRVLCRVDANALQKIHTANDHKGTLMITWADIPDTRNMESVELAWYEESEHWVEHTFPDGRTLNAQPAVSTREQKS